MGVRSSTRSYPAPGAFAMPHRQAVPSVAYDPSCSGNTIYMQSKRHHHRHYFSNLDLFTTTSTYNYLKYAKADFSQESNNNSKQPHLIVRNIGFEKDERSLFDILMLRAPKYAALLENISFELRGGETLAIMYTSSKTNFEKKLLKKLFTYMFFTTRNF